MKEQLGIAVIGCGYWGGHYVRLFTQLQETHVVAVCDLIPENLKNIKQRFPDVTITSDYNTILDMPGIDAVVIVTTAHHHYDIARKFIEAGKHILIEKPMTTRVEDAEHLIELADARQVTLMVGHVYLYNSAVRKMKSYIEEGRIGQLYYLYTQRTNLGPVRYDVNSLWDLATHDVSILNYLLDATPLWVNAVGHQIIENAREDVGFITLGYPNNVIGHIHVSWADPDKVRDIVIVGSEMRLYFNDLNPQEPIRIFEKGLRPPLQDMTDSSDYRFTIRDGDIISPNIPLSEPLREQCSHFVECVLTGQRPLSDGQNGLDVVRILSAVDRSLELRGQSVQLYRETNTV